MAAFFGETSLGVSRKLNARAVPGEDRPRGLVPPEQKTSDGPFVQKTFPLSRVISRSLWSCWMKGLLGLPGPHLPVYLTSLKTSFPNTDIFTGTRH